MSLGPFIQSLLERTDLLALIQERTSLKRAGATYTGCCPFHDEKTPSFHVYHQSSPAHYHCYGCGAHGDAITFLREQDHLEFMEALEKLANRAGMEIPRQDPKLQQQYDRQNRLYQAMASALNSYQEQLRTHPQRAYAQDYIDQRGVSPEMVDLYGLGFAPPERHWLAQTPNPQLVEDFRTLKLVHDGRDGRSAFDMFANRLMFPIRDRRGRCVAFGGRTLANDKSKYINSSETPVFIKRQEVYGLWETRQKFRNIDQLIVVEGYLDVIALTQFGIPGAVAMLGTATNEESLSNLLGLSDNLVFCFDGDAAGVAAADKAMQKILPLYQAGHQIHFLLLPAGEDPDTFVRHQGPEAFKKSVSQASPLSRYFLESLQRDLDVSIPEQRLLWRKRANDLLAPLKGQAIYQALNNSVYEATRAPRFENGKPLDKRGHAPHQSQSPVDPVRNRSLQTLALYCLQHPEQAEKTRQQLTHLNREGRDGLPLTFIDWIAEAKLEQEEDVLYALSTEAPQQSRFDKLLQGLPVLPSRPVLRQEAEDTLRQMAKARLDQDLNNLTQSLQQNPQDATLKEALKKLLETRQTLASVENGSS